MSVELNKRRELIVRHIITMYEGTTPANKEELKKFARYIIDQYDLDDLYEVIKQECQENNKYDDEPNIVDLEYEEYKFNVLNRRGVC